MKTFHPTMILLYYAIRYHELFNKNINADMLHKGPQAIHLRLTAAKVDVKHVTENRM